MFKDQYHPAVKKDLKKIDIQTRKEIQDEWLPILLQYPYQGQVLAGPLYISCNARNVKNHREMSYGSKRHFKG